MRSKTGLRLQEELDIDGLVPIVGESAKPRPDRMHAVSTDYPKQRIATANIDQNNRDKSFANY